MVRFTQLIAPAALASVALAVAACGGATQAIKTVTVEGGDSVTGATTCPEGQAADEDGGCSDIVETEPAPTADPDGDYTSNCDMLLKEGSGYSYYGLLVGDARIHNTGNVGIVVNVKGTWDRAGFGPFKAEKENLRLDVGARKTVHLRERIDQEGIDEVQSSGGYSSSGNFCRVKVSIVDSFGEPQ
jgi:hypothetical protein